MISSGGMNASSSRTRCKNWRSKLYAVFVLTKDMTSTTVNINFKGTFQFPRVKPTPLLCLIGKKSKVSKKTDFQIKSLFDSRTCSKTEGLACGGLQVDDVYVYVSVDVQMQNGLSNKRQQKGLLWVLQPNSDRDDALPDITVTVCCAGNVGRSNPRTSAPKCSTPCVRVFVLFLFNRSVRVCWGCASRPSFGPKKCTVP